MKTNIHFLLYLAQFFLKRKIFLANFVEEVKTHILCSIIIFFFFENRAVCEKMWKNIVERGRLQTTVWRMRIACWITKATNTHSEYLKVIAFSTTTMVTRAHLNVTLYVHCLSRFPFQQHTARCHAANNFQRLL